jgi:adenine-specific DNA-methyltransferase
MEKLKMKSPDLSQKNIEKLRELFPNCVTEFIDPLSNSVSLGVDFELLSQELSGEVITEGVERYSFTWPDKRAAIHAANTSTEKTLRPRRNESVDFDTTKNLYIEGDNLEVLKLLRESYLAKVKMIYIDPPYNTGNDFVYNDRFSQSYEEFAEACKVKDEQGNLLFNPKVNGESNGRFHTDWLNMMYPRLKVSRDLLSSDGVIFINIDEHEVINLTKILDEIYGESNRLGTIIWDKRNPKGDAKAISVQHEYILVYAKDAGVLTSRHAIVRKKKNADLMLSQAKRIFSQNKPLKEINKEYAVWIKSQKQLSGGEQAYAKIDENGKVYREVSMAWPNNTRAPDDYFIPLIHPTTHKPCPIPAKGWRNPPATMKRLLDAGLIIFGDDETTQPRRKYLLEENLYENIPSLLYFGGADQELKKLEIPFDTPKILGIIKEHISSFCDGDDIVLDFFSGSATTAHAVMKFNAEEQKNLKYIMVQLPELTAEKSAARKAGYETICEIGKERIRRAGDAIVKEASLFDSSFDKGFRVLKLADSNMQEVYYTPSSLDQKDLFSAAENVKSDRTAEDLLFQVMPECGCLFSDPIEKFTVAGKEVFKVNHGQLLACFESEVDEDVIIEIAKMQPIYFVTRDSSIAKDQVLDNFEQLFKSYSPLTKLRII